MNKYNALDANKICFITCTNNEEYYEECIKYIYSLNIPLGIEIEVVTISDAKSLTEGYNRGMKSSNAKYKVYLHQDVFIINKNFIADVIELFNMYSNVGILGMIGSTNIPLSGKWWESNDKYGKVIENSLDNQIRNLSYGVMNTPLKKARFLDGFCLITQYDMNWNEETLKGWHFYDLAQCMEFERNGYEIGIINQNEPWCIHDCGSLNLEGYENQLEIFIKEYAEYVYPLVSVLIPTFNRPAYFEKALNSVLNQSYMNIEIIVCDDSTDQETELVIKKYLQVNKNIKYYKNRFNLGQFKNDLKCIELAKGEFINFLMDDDLFKVDKIEKMMTYFIEDINKEINLITSHRQLIDDQNNFLPDWNSTRRLFDVDTLIKGVEIGNFLLKNSMNSIGEPTTPLFRKSALKEPFGYFADIAAVCNVDLVSWLNIMSEGNIVYIAETLSYFRIHEGQQLHNHRMLVAGGIDYSNIVLNARDKGFLTKKEDYVQAIESTINFINKIFEKINTTSITTEYDYFDLVNQYNKLKEIEKTEKINAIEDSVSSSLIEIKEVNSKVNINHKRSINDEYNFYQTLRYETGLDFELENYPMVINMLIKTADINKEYSLFEHISVERIKEILGKSNNIGVIGHWSNLVTSEYDFPIKSVEPNEKRGFSPLQLSKIKQLDNLLITNVELSNLLVLDKRYLKEVSNEIREAIIMPFYLFTNKIAVTWDTNFGFYYTPEQNYIRWNQSQKKKGVIYITNSSKVNIEFSLQFNSRVLQGEGKLNLFLNDSQYQVDLTTTSNNIALTNYLIPGKNSIYFEYTGSNVSDEKGRLYNFCVENFKITTNDMVIEKEEAYCLLDKEHESNYFSEIEIREKLHTDGFFEVSATVFMMHSLHEMNLYKSRFMAPNKEYEYEYEKGDIEITDLNKQGVYSVLAFFYARRKASLGVII